jgi:hypothetical protein
MVRAANGLARSLALPTVFHITHHKAGSQWIHRMFHALDYHRLVLPELGNAQFLERPVEAGKIYPTLYITREQFLSVPRPADSRHFVMVRDLRDTLVSAYFSIRYSHPPLAGGDVPFRRELNELSAEEGLLLLLERWLAVPAQVQWSWAASGEELVRYEDLLAHDTDILERVLHERCGLGADRAQLASVVRAHRFEAWTGGRPRGEEDVRAHERKGVAGDWRNHFTPKVTRAFKDLYGSLLIASGYADTFDW